MTVKAKIKDIDEHGNATIIAPIDVHTFIKQDNKECYVEYIDSRPLSDKQRKFCYSLIGAIADFTGDEREREKELLKFEFMSQRMTAINDRIFSLSNAPMSLVCDFQRFLIDFVLSYDVPLKFNLLEYVDDVSNYVYMCLIHKKCCVCGKTAELHHVDTVGMGNDRTEIEHLGREALSLCREHHTEFHTIGKQTFFEKYHIIKGVEIDKTILKIYGLKR